MTGELLFGVARHRLVQVALVAALRHPDPDTRAAQVGEPLLVGRPILRFDRNEHRLGNAERRFVSVELLQQAVDQLARVERLDLVDDEPLATDDPSLADVEHLHRRFEVVLGEPDDVEVLVLLGDHLLLGDCPLDRSEPVAQTGGLLELELLRRRPHVVAEAVDHLVGVALEELAQLLDELAVRHLVDLADARSGALLDVEQQARPAEPVVLVELARRAGPDREGSQQQVERVADRVGVRVRPEVTNALALAPAHHHRSRPLLVEGDGEERIALVVAQSDVEPRAVLLDQRVLEHQCLDLVAHLDPLHRRRGGDHRGGPRVKVARILEVVRQALPEARGLADVDHPAELVAELVRAGRLGDRSGGGSADHRRAVAKGRLSRRGGA